MHGKAQLQLATQQDETCTADKFDDAKVRGSNGKELGELRDFLVDPQAGAIRYAVVSSGGWVGIGDKLRLVPFAALKLDNRDSGDRSFSVAMTESQWKQAPTLKEDAFEEGRVTLNEQQQRQVSQALANEAAQADANAQLWRVSKIRGLDVTANNQDIGSVEGVVIRPGESSALALFDGDQDFVGTEQKFLVPIKELQIANVGNGSAQTTLTRDDFQRVASSSSSGATASNDVDANVSGARDSANATMDATSGTSAADLPNQTPASMAANESSNATSAGSANATTSTSTVSANRSPGANSTSTYASSNATNAKSDDQATTNSTSTGSSSTTVMAATNAPVERSTYNNDTASQNHSEASQDHQSEVGPHVAMPTPTGFSSAEQNPTTTQKLIDGAHAIRAALDQNQDTAHENVTIIPVNGKITLKGTVSSDARKAEVERIANRAGEPNVVISNLQVEND
jgi:sporulation protein YlmC with PRC-barrel domain